LVERGLSATFFLSGRWRDGFGPYWWELLEDRLRERGVAEVAASYGLPPGSDAPAIARALTGTSLTDEFATVGGDREHVGMTLEDARSLVAAGMEVGFHTLHHPSLPTLDDEGLDAAVSIGRHTLADELGTPVQRFAYPHGHVDGRIAETVRSHGYRSAWTTRKRLVSRGEDPMLQGRWDLGHRPADGFRAALLRGLARPYR
jgi:peptidoglycan/xylan/chitin deacetylase (PgdA/CDA1 family)